MSATVVYKSVHTATTPLVFYFPKMTPGSLLSTYLKHLRPGMRYYCANGTALTPLSRCAQPWVLATLVAVKEGAEQVYVPSLEHVISYADRDEAKAQYQAWLRGNPQEGYLRSLEAAEDNVSIVSVKPTTLHFSRDLEHVREFEKAWNVKSVTDDAEQAKEHSRLRGEETKKVTRRRRVADLQHAVKALHTEFPSAGPLRTGCDNVTLTYTGKDQRILVVFKSAKLFARVLDSTVLLPFLDVRPEACAAVLAPLADTAVMAKDMPRNAKTLALVQDLVDRLYAARIMLASGEAGAYIALDKARGRLYFQLPACMAPAPLSLSKKAHSQQMLDMITKSR